MKTTTFHFLAQAAREYLDFESIGLDPEMSPLEFFSRTNTVPGKRMIEKLTDTYEKHDLKVIVPRSGHTDPVDIHTAVTALGDVLRPTVGPVKGKRGRPRLANTVNLMGLKELLFKHNYKVRDLAEIIGLYPSTMSALLRGPQPVTSERLELILSGAQMLMTGDKQALKDLRVLEKEI